MSIKYLEKAIDLINEITESNAQPSMSFGFGFSDDTEEALEDQLIEAAINDARQKSNLIARSAGIQLGAIKLIKYDPAPVRHPQVMAMAERSAARQDQMDFGGFQVPEIELQRSIVIQWNID